MSPLQNPPDEHILAQQADVQHFMQAVTHHLPASNGHIDFYRQGKANYPTVSKVIVHCQSGWLH